MELDIIALPLSVSSLNEKPLLVVAETSISEPERKIADCGIGSGILGRAPDEDWKATIRYSTNPQPGREKLQLTEHVRYQIRLCAQATRDLIRLDEFTSDFVESSLSGLEATNWKFDRRSGTGELKVEDHYGSSWIRIGDAKRHFDITSWKLDYETEYRAMLEDIASHCEALISSWGSPTSFSASPSEEEPIDTLLEQFIIARGLFEAYQLDSAARAVQRNPDTSLERSENWKPLQTADPQAFLRDPVARGRDWRRIGDDRFPVNPIPGEVKNFRKQESHDTPANRFVKFVLERFEDVFWRVSDNDEIYGFANSEATDLANRLSDITKGPFWKEIGPLSRLPTRNRLFQERRGYRETLRAWLGLRSASVLDWKGASNIFRGPARNVATLYEYWLYFEFRSQINDIEGIEEHSVSDGSEIRAFVEEEGERISVRLDGGKSSVSEFRGKVGGSPELCLLFFYNRGFSGSVSYPEIGSYSRGWRPDFSIALFPIEYRLPGESWKTSEMRASQEEDISYVSFEAKYKSLSSTGENDDPSLTSSGDFAELHAYRDGINYARSAFLVHPGH